MKNEVIDVMSQFAGEAAKFTVNVAAVSVPLIYDVGAFGRMSKEGTNSLEFQYRDNVTILSIGCILPLGFEFYEQLTGAGNPQPNNYFTPFVTWGYQRISDNAIATVEPDSFHIPWANNEMSIGVHYTTPEFLAALGDDKFRLVAQFPADTSFDIEISMLNVDAALDGLEFNCPIFMKVLHSLAIIA